MKLIMMVGLPGAGKSTKSSEYAEKGYIVHSPDAIRNELNLHSNDDTQKVYDILHEHILADMNKGKDIVYDSTNLTRRRRLKFLNLIKKYDYEKICHVLLTPLDLCKERNSQRIGYSKVPDNELNRMSEMFTIPMSDEGWDKIILNINDSKMEVL